MTKGNDTLKIPGQTRDRKRQKNNGNNHNRVRLIIGLGPYTHLSTAVAWREKKSKHFVLNKYFCLVLGLHKSKISKKSNEPLGRKPNYKLFHYKARVQPVSKITTIAIRNRCWMYK